MIIKRSPSLQDLLGVKLILSVLIECTHYYNIRPFIINGIATYNHMPSLKYTDDDAYKMYAFLKSPEGGALPDNQVKILVDDMATKEEILGAMEDVYLRADENDVIMLYYSGHGLEGSFIMILMVVRIRSSTMRLTLYSNKVKQNTKYVMQMLVIQVVMLMQKVELWRLLMIITINSNP